MKALALLVLVLAGCSRAEADERSGFDASRTTCHRIHRERDLYRCETPETPCIVTGAGAISCKWEAK